MIKKKIAKKKITKKIEEKAIEKKVKNIELKLVFEADTSASLTDMVNRLKFAMKALEDWHHLKYKDRKME